MRNVRFRTMTCKVKHFVAFVVSAVITSFIVCMFNRQQPVNLQNIVSETTKHLEQFKVNLQGNSKEKKFEVEDRLLTQLGFRNEVYKNSSGDSKQFRFTHGSSTDFLHFKDDPNNSLPIVIVSSVDINQLPLVPGFLANIHSRNVLPSNSIVLWGLEKDSNPEDDSEFMTSVKQLCNSSKCWVEKFNYNDYPAHVKDTELRAYRPLIIQTMLERGGCILWIDIDRRLLPLSKDFLSGFLNMALNGGSNGIVGWSAGRPTSSFTHPKTFTYFQTDAENYYFHRMIDPAQLLICNTEEVHNKIMLPWVECSLTKDCIDPFGAQSTGCRFDKKPLYRYSGCHGYDSSALNVALGLTFPLHQPYISRAPISQPVKPATYNQTTRTKQ